MSSALEPPSEVFGSHQAPEGPLDTSPCTWYTIGMSGVQLPSLSTELDTFALAVIEYGGNLGAAYRSVFGEEVRNPAAKAREMVTRPEVASRIQQLSVAVEEHAYISLGSHLTKLAEIRDLAIGTDQLKVALGAEAKRGEAAGFYAGKLNSLPGSPETPANTNPSVIINIGTSSANVQEWAAKHGKAPVVIDI